MEPPVVDASLTLSWCFADEETPYRRAVLAALKTTYAVVPALSPFEVANVRQLPIQVERRETLLALAGDITTGPPTSS